MAIDIYNLQPTVVITRFEIVGPALVVHYYDPTPRPVPHVPTIATVLARA